uniref:Uncharacterized protein n=1 Tax=Kalanchoe fedtschenkoi TaxID=63787 RepID=A0A7N1A2S7_KALFE
MIFSIKSKLPDTCLEISDGLGCSASMDSLYSTASSCDLEFGNGSHNHRPKFVGCLMTSVNLRRRLHHGDIDGKRSEHLDSSPFHDATDQPLLANDQGSGDDDDFDERKKEELQWSFLFSDVISQWTQFLGEHFF